MRMLYLVRHGMYDPVSGADNRTANALNALGREQAAFTGDRLAALPMKFDVVTSSEFTRARETGDIIAAKLGMKCERDRLLNESLAPGIDAARLQLTPVPGAEEQFNAAWLRYSRPAHGAPRNDLIVCHGNVIRWFVCKAIGLDTTQWTRIVAANCSLAFIKIYPDGIARLFVYNDVSHLPLEKQTWEPNQKPLWPAPEATKSK